jgi:hypothetical protein
MITMKKTLLMSAMLFTGVAMASPISSTTNLTPISIQQEEKVKIEAENLPEPIRTAITRDEAISQFPIAEAWQITQADGTYHYKVTFENGTEEKVSKTYDKDGVEIDD